MAKPITLPLDSARTVVQALRHLPGTCRYHGTDFERLGIEPWGEPRCDSCKAPWWRRRAEALFGVEVEDGD